MRVASGLAAVVIKRRSDKLAKKMKDDFIPHGFTREEVRTKFAAGLVRNLTHAERVEKLRTPKRIRMRTIQLGDEPRDKYLIPRAELSATPEVNMPSRVIAEQIYKLETDGHVPYHTFKKACIQDPMFRSTTHWARSFNHMKYKGWIEVFSPMPHEEAVRTGMRNRPWSVRLTKAGNRKFVWIHQKMKGELDMEHATRRLRKLQAKRLEGERAAQTLASTNGQDTEEPTAGRLSRAVQRVRDLFRWQQPSLPI